MDYNKMTLEELRSDLIIDAQKGYPFFLAGALYWLVMGVMGLTLGASQQTALYMLWGCASIFPLAIAISKVLKINLLSKNPLGVLGGIIGGIQAFYLPVWIVTYIEHYEWLPMMIGILGASHFLPYLWIYRSRTYGVFTAAMALISFVLGYILKDQAFTTLPFVLTVVYLAAVAGLRLEAKAFGKSNGHPIGR